MALSADGVDVAFAAFRRAYPAYDGTAKLDEMRATEYARLDRQHQIYLDYTGGGIYAESQLRKPRRSITSRRPTRAGPRRSNGFVPGKKDLLFTSVHEVMPGHFLQFLHANRSPSLFGRLFVGYAFAEGWAHYAEEMMWDAGLGNGDPGDAYRPAHQRVAARLPLPVGDRHARARHDAGAVVQDVPRAMLSGRGQCRAAGGARHLRSGLSQLHDGQADDPQAARRLDRDARRAQGVEGVPRPVPELWRPADPAGARGDDGRERRRRSFDRMERMAAPAGCVATETKREARSWVRVF